MSKLFRRRDIAILVIIIITAYVTLDTSSFSYVFEPAWYLDQRNFKKVKSYRPILPIITDIDGDGQNEVLLITKNFDIKILSANTPVDDRKEIYVPKQISSVSIPQLSDNSALLPVALSSGYASGYKPDQRRSQLIVLMREDLSITCFTSNLEILWQRTLAHKLHSIDGLFPHYTIQDVAINIVPISISDGSTGLVIVGISMVPKDRNSDIRIRIENDFANENRDRGDQVGINMQSQLEHFSIYALNASNGNVLWRHDGVDVKPEQYIRSLPLHAQKLDIMADLSLHAHVAAGMNDWTVFRQSLLAELPHYWDSLDDTSLRIAHFVRRHVGAGAKSQVEKKLLSKSIDSDNTESRHLKSKNIDAKDKMSFAKRLNFDMNRFTGVETPQLSLSTNLPHDAVEHTENPNVLVAHTSRGLEVISLRTGSPVTSLSMTRNKMYTDIDGDGIVDTISVLETPHDVAAHSASQIHDNKHLHHCMVVVTSGLPAQAQLFNGSLCPGLRHLHDPARRGHTSLPIAIKAAKPVVYHARDPRTLLESRTRNIAIAINTGVVTSYSGSGRFLWQVDGAPSWSLGFEHGFAALFDADAARFHELGCPDPLKAQFLILGEKSFALLSREGNTLISTDLPNAPITRPIFGDFNNDGSTDLVLITEDAILGYRLEVVPSTKLMFITLVILSFIAMGCFVMNIRMESVTQVDGSAMPGAKLKSKIKKNILGLMRSTDDFHIE